MQVSIKVGTCLWHVNWNSDAYNTCQRHVPTNCGVLQHPPELNWILRVFQTRCGRVAFRAHLASRLDAPSYEFECLSGICDGVRLARKNKTAGPGGLAVWIIGGGLD